jgi:hypothetical protein
MPLVTNTRSLLPTASNDLGHVHIAWTRVRVSQELHRHLNRVAGLAIGFAQRAQDGLGDYAVGEQRGRLGLSSFDGFGIDFDLVPRDHSVHSGKLLLQIDDPPWNLFQLLFALVDLTLEPRSLADKPRHRRRRLQQSRVFSIFRHVPIVPPRSKAVQCVS